MRFVVICILVVSAFALKHNGPGSLNDEKVLSEYSNKDLFDAFMALNERSYSSLAEQRHRFNIFTENLVDIRAHNSKVYGEGHRLGLTTFADRTLDEFEALSSKQANVTDAEPRSTRRSLNQFNAPPPVIGYGNSAVNNKLLAANPNMFDSESKRMYDAYMDSYQSPVVRAAGIYFGVYSNELHSGVSWDWRSLNAVTKVKNQGLFCGSCWAFAGTGALETYAWIRAGALAGSSVPVFSEQIFVDCASGYGGGGCGGGNPSSVFTMTKFVGIALESKYTYQGFQWFCDDSKKIGNNMNVANAFYVVRHGDDQLIRRFLRMQPLVSTMSLGGLFLYKSGIYFGKAPVPAIAAVHHDATEDRAAYTTPAVPGFVPSQENGFGCGVKYDHVVLIVAYKLGSVEFANTPVGCDSSSTPCTGYVFYQHGFEWIGDNLGAMDSVGRKTGSVGSSSAPPPPGSQNRGGGGGGPGRHLLGGEGGSGGIQTHFEVYDGIPQNYWVIKNSYGTQYGVNGYSLFAMGKNIGLAAGSLNYGICGVAQKVQFPVYVTAPAGLVSTYNDVQSNGQIVTGQMGVALGLGEGMYDSHLTNAYVEAGIAGLFVATNVINTLNPKGVALGIKDLTNTDKYGNGPVGTMTNFGFLAQNLLDSSEYSTFATDVSKYVTKKTLPMVGEYFNAGVYAATYGAPDILTMTNAKTILKHAHQYQQNYVANSPGLFQPVTKKQQNTGKKYSAQMGGYLKTLVPAIGHGINIGLLDAAIVVPQYSDYLNNAYNDIQAFEAKNNNQIKMSDKDIGYALKIAPEVVEYTAEGLKIAQRYVNDVTKYLDWAPWSFPPKRAVTTSGVLNTIASCDASCSAPTSWKILGYANTVCCPMRCSDCSKSFPLDGKYGGGGSLCYKATEGKC